MIAMHKYLYVYEVHTNVQFDILTKKTKRAPPAGIRRENGRGRPWQSREGRARWGTSSNQRTERWTSSRARAPTAQNLVKIWLFDCWDDMANIILHVFISNVCISSASQRGQKTTRRTNSFIRQWSWDRFQLYSVAASATANLVIPCKKNGWRHLRVQASSSNVSLNPRKKCLHWVGRSGGLLVVVTLECHYK